MERRTVMLSVTRRQFLQFSAVSAAGLSASSLGGLGFSSTQVLAEVREYKLARTTETRNTCPYCSVGDRKSTRLNSSHGYISYAVFCLKKIHPRRHHHPGCVS